MPSDAASNWARLFRDPITAFLAAVLVACLAGSYITRSAGSPGLIAKRPAPAGQSSLIDQRLLQAARQLAPIAGTNEEQDLAREALRLADHELDQAFATALREASASAPPASGPLKQISDCIAQIKARIAAGQSRAAQLTKEAATRESAADQLELLKAQLALDQDEVEDAQQDLARQGGDIHSRLERALQEHDAAQHETTPAKVTTDDRTATLKQQAALWFRLTDSGRQVQGARQQAADRSTALARQHDALEKLVNNKLQGNAGSVAVSAAGGNSANKEASSRPGRTGQSSSGQASPTQALPSEPSSGDTDEEEDTAVLVTRLHRLSDQRKTLAELDKRIQDVQQLSDVYARWAALVESRRRAVLHLLLLSLAAVFAIVLSVVVIDKTVRHAFAREADRRRLHHLRVISIIAAQVIGAFLVLLIVFGAPDQTSTIVGLATAGLTVVLKDFIVAFFGWFVLMGRNGVHTGDWVEIEGVGGEVIEIGLLRTVLLEMGNWTSTGHPTGRRVAFPNSFAVEGHYFNFSTAGQWLWDDLQVTLPASGDPYEMAEQIRRTVEKETEKEGALAQQDWERVTHQYGVRPFSAKPAVDLRPAADGLHLIVRYITRAPQRYEVKSRLFQAIIALMHKPAGGPAGSVQG